jgi:hypothetical protein
MICCNSIYQFGCIDSCGVDAVIPATLESGDYRARFMFNGGIKNVEFQVPEGSDSFTIPMAGMNENYQHIVSIQKSNGDPQSFTIEGVEYDCISITTMPTL